MENLSVRENRYQAKSHPLPRTSPINGSRPQDYPRRRTSSRVPLHRVVLGEPYSRSGHPLLEAVMLPGRWGWHANTDRPPLDEAAADDEGDERFTSGCSGNEAPYRRLDSTPTSLRPQSLIAISLPATPSNHAAFSISSSAESRLPDRRREEVVFLQRGRERAERWRSAAGQRSTVPLDSIRRLIQRLVRPLPGGSGPNQLQPGP